MSDNTINDGGPAYPSITRRLPGMSLRDWFAGQALAGSLASLINNYNDAKINIVSRESGLTIEQVIAKSCYSWADAMLAARGGVK